MTFVTTCLIAVGLVGALGFLAAHEHKKARDRRLHPLDACAALLRNARLTHGGDAFPRLRGSYGGLDIDVQLICDTMVMRRLPQLWLQVTVLERRPDIGGVAALVRPAGYEFYSLTGVFEHVIEPPPLFPAETVVRGESQRAEHTFDLVSGPMAAILFDPAVKEVAVTREGLRIMRQAAEGRRGEHLLLRQAVFDNAAVPAECLERTLHEIEAIRALLGPPRKLVLVA